ncbi:DUF2953 domain-containing protein [Paenibacillus sp. JDR-2]|uniref:DUF2953 domain-containing protein n=1 Tax=Paenibacillus sp. (strain JDR-2) TaxID=324057 RepID=UPI0001666CD3|nr:DUF2953 domain-containing protein [Paenibacillus sp. JDR-2]ACT01013.1 hypothetical protein Pjdr2_2358 [Paenibacillus sp. JDR-2]
MIGYPYVWVLAAGLIIVLFLLIALVSPVVIQGEMRRDGENDDIEINFKALFGLLRYKLKIRSIDFSGKAIRLHEHLMGTSIGMSSKDEKNDEIDTHRVMVGIEKYKRAAALTYNLSHWAKQTLAKVRLEEWKWFSYVGTGDAMWTAMATGALWSVKTTTLGVLSQFVKLSAEPRVEVQPVYAHTCFRTEWTCIAKIGLGNAIMAGLHLLVRLRNAKEGVQAWRSLLFKA